MSGLGPAACWLAHKRIESWSRMAKERVGAVRRVTLDRNSADESSGSGGSNGCAQVLPGSEGAASTTPPLPQQMTPPPSASSVTSTTSGIGSVSAGSVSDSCDLPTDSEVLSYIDQDSLKTAMLILVFFVPPQEVNVAKESQHIQPASQMHGMPCIPNHPITSDVMRGPGEGYHSPLHLHHQSRSFPPRLQRTPSISSQSSVDSAPSRQSVGSVDSRRAAPVTCC